MSLADIAASGGDTESARTILEAAAGADPTNGDLQLHYAQAVLDSGRNEDAVKIVRQAVERMPADTKLAVGAAQLELRAGNAALAAATFQSVIKRGAGGAAALNGLGVARVQAADLPGAEEAFRRAVALAPGDYAARNNLALVLVLQGRAGDAVPMLKSLASEPGIPGRVKHNLALAYAQQGDTRQAADALEGVVTGSAATREATDLAALRSEQGTELVHELGPAEIMDGKSSGRAYAGDIPPPTTPAQPAAAAATANVADTAAPAAGAAPPAPLPLKVVVKSAPVGTVQSAALEQSAADLIKPFINNGTAPRPPVPADPAPRVVRPTQTAATARPIALTDATPAATPMQESAAAPEPVVAAMPLAMTAASASVPVTPPPPPPPEAVADAPAATTSPVAVTEPAADGTIVVRFAAVPSRSDAMAVWKQMAGDVPDLLSGRSPVLAMAADQDAPWTIGTGGFQDKAAAQAFCDELRARAQSCAVGL